MPLECFIAFQSTSKPISNRVQVLSVTLVLRCIHCTSIVIITWDEMACSGGRGVSGILCEVGVINKA